MRTTGMVLLASLLACTDSTAPDTAPDLVGQYVGTGVWRADGLAVMSVLDMTVEQAGDSIYGTGLISGVVLSDEETIWYDNDYEFGGTVSLGEPITLEVGFNSGWCLEHLPRPCVARWRPRAERDGSRHR
ncbi:MAG: hypothetical protein OXK74_17125 [Gemmatimonadota bacterium]|nr:hypothetical protein [Gemmatimonadota bacterium]